MKIVVNRDYKADAEPGGDSATGLIAAALVAFESEFETAEPEAVVVADDSELSLAAALVATKLLIPLEATADATSAESPNGRVLAQLASPSA